MNIYIYIFKIYVVCVYIIAYYYIFLSCKRSSVYTAQYAEDNIPVFWTQPLKGAVCKILTLLKHKNTIICLQIFKKHAKLTYLFIWKTMLQSVILLWKCAFRAGMSVFVLVCETRPLPVYPIVFRHPGLPVGRKHSVFHFIHRQVCSFLLVSSIWQPACASSLRRRGRVKKPSPIFWIWTAIPSSTTLCQSYIQHL